MPEFSWSCFLFDAESPDDMDMPCMSATDWRRLWFLACSAAASSSSVLPVANGLSPVGDRPDSRRLGFMLIVTEGRRRAAILSAVFFEGVAPPSRASLQRAAFRRRLRGQTDHGSALRRPEAPEEPRAAPRESGSRF